MAIPDCYSDLYTDIAHPVHYPEPVLVSPLFGETFNKRILRAPLPYYMTAQSEPIIAPTNFITDYASIPRIFWSWIPAWGPYGPAAITHDLLYSGVHGMPVPNPADPLTEVALTRKIADQIFLKAMAQLEVHWFKRHIMYQAVRVFGGSCYRKLPPERRKVMPVEIV